MSRLVALAFVMALFSWFGREGWAQPAQREWPRDVNLKVGDPAPDFELGRLNAKGQVKLSSFKGEKPVVLIFGSYT